MDDVDHGHFAGFYFLFVDDVFPGVAPADEGRRRRRRNAAILWRFGPREEIGEQGRTARSRVGREEGEKGRREAEASQRRRRVYLRGGGES